MINLVMRMAVDYEKVGLRINYLRKNAKLKQKELADMINISPKYLSNLETGRKHVNLDLISELCNVFDTTYDYFMLGYIRQNTDENIMDLLKLCSEDDKKVVFEMVRLFAQRNQK